MCTSIHSLPPTCWDFEACMEPRYSTFEPTASLSSSPGVLVSHVTCVISDRHLRRRPAITIATATAASPGITRGSRFSTLAAPAPAAATAAVSPASRPTSVGVHLNGRESRGVAPAGQCFRSEGGACSTDGSGVAPAATRSRHTGAKSSEKTLQTRLCRGHGFWCRMIQGLGTCWMEVRR